MLFDIWEPFMAYNIVPQCGEAGVVPYGLRSRDVKR